MKKITYWKIQCIDDADCYSIRAKTKKKALEIYHQNDNSSYYDDIVLKVVITAKGTHDLVFKILGEDHDDGYDIKEYKIKRK